MAKADGNIISTCLNSSNRPYSLVRNLERHAALALTGIQRHPEWRISVQISKVMSTGVKIASPKQSIQDAAHMMMEIDAGAIPVGEGDRLVGMI